MIHGRAPFQERMTATGTQVVVVSDPNRLKRPTAKALAKRASSLRAESTLLASYSTLSSRGRGSCRQKAMASLRLARALLLSRQGILHYIPQIPSMAFDPDGCIGYTAQPN